MTQPKFPLPPHENAETHARILARLETMSRADFEALDEKAGVSKALPLPHKEYKMSDTVCDIGAVKAIVGRRKYFWINENLECDGPCGKIAQTQKAAIVSQLAEGLDRLGFTVDVEYDWADCAMVIYFIRLSDGAVVDTDTLRATLAPASPPRQVVVDLFKPQSTLPHRQHPGDAGYDLYANEAMTINVGAIKLVRCGFKMAIPRGVVGFICPRSGLALKRGVTVLNGPGVIDPGFEDELGVVLINLGDRHFEVAVGDRIAQIVFVETAAVEIVAGQVGGGGAGWAEAGGALATTRRGGFGSSGGFERAKMEQSLVDAIVNQKKV